MIILDFRSWSFFSVYIYLKCTCPVVAIDVQPHCSACI